MKNGSARFFGKSPAWKKRRQTTLPGHRSTTCSAPVRLCRLSRCTSYDTFIEISFSSETPRVLYHPARELLNKGLITERQEPFIAARFYLKIISPTFCVSTVYKNFCVEERRNHCLNRSRMTLLIVLYVSKIILS